MFHTTFVYRLSAYPSFLRPEGIPEVDWLTLFLIRCIWIISGQFATIPPLKWFLVQTGIMGLLKRLHATLMVTTVVYPCYGLI